MRDLKVILNQIKVEDIRTIYSGKLGCACGCGGEYREGEKAKRFLANMKRFAEGREVLEQDGLNNEWIIYIEDEELDRAYRVYLNKKPE